MEPWSTCLEAKLTAHRLAKLSNVELLMAKSFPIWRWLMLCGGALPTTPGLSRAQASLHTQGKQRGDANPILISMCSEDHIFVQHPVRAQCDVRSVAIVLKPYTPLLVLLKRARLSLQVLAGPPLHTTRVGVWTHSVHICLFGLKGPATPAALPSTSASTCRLNCGEKAGVVRMWKVCPSRARIDDSNAHELRIWTIRKSTD
eukprot:CAMPEP_0178462740 /NCGR_PEP_ID=MMETSP0689_2-20121128/49977_1 /TAXON_ID=160604 /ORGANISM="Amphidinium massartii, Strain CS-259" /LENGTH=201 /DNA_ID=CAMNT_0020089609 /DNA_START=109 /DNA_END=715 /DNA_ORIENTATION=-